MESNSSSMAAYLAEHPKMVGVLFTMLVVLSQGAGVVAAGQGTTVGP
ncbi:hypothetical protein SY89_01697 [Halolamina pelagica]|uniref:Uncharacterized protein n=1 Tax=Halolamina pelagica TaxID=699431 RepID=A0A0P7FVI7_9EURY|nr:hypothetical protein [Halolamina pelagica]KPN30956.1 hypothetical protein SY89_01697 [Halolamina pelagica]